MTPRSSIAASPSHTPALAKDDRDVRLVDAFASGTPGSRKRRQALAAKLVRHAADLEPGLPPEPPLAVLAKLDELRADALGPAGLWMRDHVRPRHGRRRAHHRRSSGSARRRDRCHGRRRQLASRRPEPPAGRGQTTQAARPSAGRRAQEGRQDNARLARLAAGVRLRRLRRIKNPLSRAKERLPTHA